MMHKFSCSNCSTEIMAEEEFQGQLVECPVCGEIQIVPERTLEAGDSFDNYNIVELTDSNIVWNTYVATGSPVSEFPDQKVTLKIPSMFLRQNLDDFDSFINVVCRNSSLNANEFPQLLERGGDSTNPFFIFKYENTLNLHEFAQLHSPMEPFEALRIIRMIAYAMNGVWNKDKIVHQNLRPANIRLTAKHGLRINEVGISQFIVSHPELIEKGLDIWNIRYMSPEFVSDGEAHTPAEDIYSLGAVFYLLLTGSEPYFDVQDVSMIPQLETPNPLKINQDITQPVYKIFNSMMEKNKQLRFKSWIKLIEEIDSVLDKSTQRISLKQYQAFDMNINKKTSKPTGHTMQSTATWIKIKNVKRDETMPLTPRKKKKKKSDVTNTQARLVKDDELRIESIQRKRIKRSKTTSIRLPVEDNTPFFKKITILCKENIALLLFSIFGLLLAGGIILYSINKQQKRRQDHAERQANIKKAREEQLTGSKTAVPEPDKSKKLSKKKKGKATEKAPIVDPNSLDGKILAVEEFYSKHPKEYNETIRRYENLIDMALQEKKFAVMDDLKDRIMTLEKLQDKLIAGTLKEIKTKCEELWKEKKHDEIIDYLTNYDGKYKEESSMKRKIYLRHFEEKLRMIEKAKKEREERKFAEIEYINKVMNEVPLQVVSHHLQTPIETLEKAEKETTYESLKPFLKKSINDLKAFKEIPTLFKKKYFKYEGKKKKLKIRNKTVSLSIDHIKDGNIYYKRRGGKIAYISCMELPRETILELFNKAERDKIESSPLFNGLLYLNQFKFDKAKANFAKLPYDLGLIFTDATGVVKQDLSLKKILKSYGIAYDPRSQLAFLEELNQAKIKEKDAKELFEKLENLIEDNKDSNFVKKNDIVFKALAAFCNKYSESKKQLKSSIVISKDGDESAEGKASSGKALKASKELSQALVKALEAFGNKKVIKLEPGVYVLPHELFDFSDVTLTGQDGVIIKGRVNIYGDNIRMSNIKFIESPFYIGSNTRKVKIENCIFQDDIVRVSDAKKVTFDNCFFRGLSFKKTKGININHCTIISPKQGSEKQAALWLDAPEIEMTNSIIYGLRYGVMFTDAGKRKNKEFKNCVWYGKKGFSALFNPLDREQTIKKSTVVVKPLRLKKYSRPRNNFYDVPQFVNPTLGNWNLIKGSPGYNGAEDGKNCGIIISK